MNIKDLKEIQEKVHADEEKQKAWESYPKQDEEDERMRLLQMSEISLWLDTYDDIFSDFDPRPYSQRALSDDFLLEAKKASKEKTSGRIELHFLIPDDKRDVVLENVIRRRLHEHFRKHFTLLEEEFRRIRRIGILTIFIGLSMMMVASYISWKRFDNLLFNLVFILLEPAGWFMTWFGLDQVFYTSNQKKPDLDFYKKMSKCDIGFISLMYPVSQKNEK